jgi:protein involved in polysaccharide export with SLBB domain
MKLLNFSLEPTAAGPSVIGSRSAARPCSFFGGRGSAIRWRLNASFATGLLAAAFLIVGCKAPQADMKMHLALREDFNAHIWRSNPPDTNTIIRVFIEGEVHHPGPLELPIGSTILDAIKQDGGFTPFASTKLLVVERSGSRIGFVLRREPFGAGFRNHYRVWYVRGQWNPTTQREDPADRAARGDAVLEREDRIWVSRTL